MTTVEESAREFLAQKRLAVAGVSRDPNQTANFIFRKLRDTGIDVVPINPHAREAEGVPCYPDLASAPGPIDGVLIVTRPEAALGIVRECAALGIRRVWMHRSFGAGSASAEAVAFGRERGLAVIDRGCPMMFCEPVDVAHRCMRWLLGLRAKPARP